MVQGGFPCMACDLSPLQSWCLQRKVLGWKGDVKPWREPREPLCARCTNSRTGGEVCSSVQSAEVMVSLVTFC